MYQYELADPVWSKISHVLKRFPHKFPIVSIHNGQMEHYKVEFQ